jgi:hypothetical protein
MARRTLILAYLAFAVGGAFGDERTALSECSNKPEVTLIKSLNQLSARSPTALQSFGMFRHQADTQCLVAF